MNMQEARDLIYQGEKVDIECKKAADSVPKSVYESYSGFANTNGGYIFLGVKRGQDKNQTRRKIYYSRDSESNSAKRGFLEYHQQ